MRQLKNVTVTHVSYVDKAANKRSFLLTKADGKPNFTKQVKPLIKEDDPQKLVYGVVYEPDVEDSQGDSMGAAEIEKAAHGFMENYQQIDKQHDFTTHAGQVVESYIAPADMEIGMQTVTKGTWVLVTKATDEIWDAIQKGDYTGYSLAGQAEVLEKSTKDDFTNRKPMNDVVIAMRVFGDNVDNIVYGGSDYPDITSKLTAILQEADEFKEVIQGISPNGVQKQGKVTKALKSLFKPNKEADEMEAKEMQELITKALEPVNNKLEELEKDQEPKETKTPTAKIDAEGVAEAVKKAVEPLSDRLEKLEKARTSNVVNDVNVTKSQENSEDVPDYVEAAFPIDK
ncbi:DNA methyltransferase [Ligilactobacillus pobuzihii]|uniref:XkdF-like putative serine protease domain-containing protein n=1 Tax=Ligilactobacillus pobuzihii TaxID=449659 RepID=UPI0019D16910|nr:XkdF-like putative serine protease domain-containing protein [Ligilactobacillus pobuzihii]MBN7275096.1 DNA methyltransferase [Ligilactobacillus pobuzihii]